MLDVVKGHVHNAFVQFHGMNDADSWGRVKTAVGSTDPARMAISDYVGVAVERVSKSGALWEGGAASLAPGSDLPLMRNTHALFEATTSLQAAENNAATMGVHFLHVELDRVVRSIDAVPDSSPLAVDPVLKPLVARAVMYAVDDFEAGVSRGLMSPGVLAASYSCDGTNPFLGFDNNANPDVNVSTVEGTVLVDSTMLALKHTSSLSFVGMQLDPPSCGETPCTRLKTDAASSWNGHRERLARAGWMPARPSCSTW